MCFALFSFISKIGNRIAVVFARQLAYIFIVVFGIGEWIRDVRWKVFITVYVKIFCKIEQ